MRYDTETGGTPHYRTPPMTYRNATAAYFAEVLLNEMAAMNGVEWAAYAEFKAQMRVAYPIVCGLLKMDPAMPLDEMAGEFVARYANAF